jgi:hypothetical protein
MSDSASRGLQPLRVSDNGRFLVKADDGAPFFWMADTAWALWMRLDHGGVLHYLDDCQDKRFNMIQVFLAAKEWAWPSGLRNALGETPFINGDPLRFNPAYMDFVTWCVEQATRRGIYTLFVVGEPMREDTPFQQITDVHTAYEYGHLLGEHFRALNNEGGIVWGLGIDEWADKGIGVPGWRAIAEGIADGVNGVDGRDGRADYSRVDYSRADYSTTLMTFHPHGGGTSSRAFHQDPWLDFNMHQTWQHYDRMVDFTSTDYRKTPTKPVVCGEPGYENADRPEMGLELLTGWHARFQAYWALFSGAFGHTYGNKNIYDFGGEYSDERYPQALDDEGRADMRHVRTLMESRPMLTRIPDPSLISSDAGEPDKHKDYVTATRAEDGSHAFVYSTNGRPFSVDLRKLGAGVVEARWFNPRDGGYTDVGAFGGERSFKPPGRVGAGNDWVLVLDATA